MLRTLRRGSTQRMPKSQREIAASLTCHTPNRCNVGLASLQKLSQNHFDAQNRATIKPGGHFRCPHPSPLPEGEGADPRSLLTSPRPLGEGKGEGISCYYCVQFKSFETVSSPLRFLMRRASIQRKGTSTNFSAYSGLSSAKDYHNSLFYLHHTGIHYKYLPAIIFY